MLLRDIYVAKVDYFIGDIGEWNLNIMCLSVKCIDL